jgi:acyl carrier protein
MDNDKRAEILGRVISALAEALELDEGDISEESRFKEDLDADSLDLVELLLQMEREYGFRITDEEAAEIKTVRDAVDVIMAKAFS